MVWGFNTHHTAMASATHLIDAALAQLNHAILHEPTTPVTDAAAAALEAMADAQARFGHLLVQWQRANGWSQDDPKRIAAAAGLLALAVHNSQWSDLSHGKLTPKPKLFAALSTLNGLLADQSWARPGVVAPKLRQLLEGSRPLLTPEGDPWLAADFFDAFIGGC